MAASLTTFVGLPNARSKSNPAQPWPRLTGSWTTFPAVTFAGTPRDTASYFQSLVRSRTPSIICCAVSFGPDSNRRRSPPVLTRTLTCDPPTSTARTRGCSFAAGTREWCQPLGLHVLLQRGILREEFKSGVTILRLKDLGPRRAWRPGPMAGLAALGATIAVALGLAGNVAAVDAVCGNGDASVANTCTYSSTGSEDTFTVPHGVHSIHVV